MARLAFIILLALGLTGIAGMAGAQSDQVLHVQKRLEELGFDPGPIDGLMGPRTRGAIRNFQEQAVLPATGELDPRTLDALAPPSIEETESPQEPPSRLGSRVPASDAERIDQAQEETQSLQESSSQPGSRVPASDTKRVDQAPDETESSQEPSSRPSPPTPISDARRVDQPQDSTNPESRDEIQATAGLTKEAPQRPMPSSDGGTKGVPLKGNSGFEDGASSVGTRVVAGPATSGSFRNRGLVMYLQRVPEWLWWMACIGGLFLLWKVLRRRTKAPIARSQRETPNLRESRKTRDQVHPETSLARISPPSVRSAPPHRTATAPPPPAPEKTIASEVLSSAWSARTVRPRSPVYEQEVALDPRWRIRDHRRLDHRWHGVRRTGMIAGRIDNGFIDPSKPVAGKADDLQATGMPYWPNYSTIHPPIARDLSRLVVGQPIRSRLQRRLCVSLFLWP